MTKSRLIELHIKKLNETISDSELNEYNTLRLNHEAYARWLDSVCSNSDLKKEILKIDRQKALNSLISETKKQKRTKIRRLATIISTAAALLIAGLFIFQDKEEVITVAEVKKSDGVIQKAQLVTEDQTYNLEQIENREIVDENFKLSNNNNRLTYTKQKDTSIYHTIKTAYCNQYSLTLSDGSIIHINSNSRVKYPVNFSNKMRQIFIEGEVYCEIAHSSTPFIVHTFDNKQVKVLGTKFNVRNYPDEHYSEITLLEGSVQVKSDKDQCILAPNQQVVINNNFEIKTVEAQYFNSWTTPIIRFHNMSINRVLDCLSQLYGVSFEIENQAIGKRKIAGGIIKQNTLIQNLNILTESCNLEYYTKNNKFILKESLSN